MTDLRYPIGPYHEESSTPETRPKFLLQIAAMPTDLRAAVKDLSEAQLDTPYRPGGWTVRKVVHHLADAHLNWYIRTKLALTENEPAIKTYDEEKWSELAEARTSPVEPSLLLLNGLHKRWVRLFESMSMEDWQRPFFHPERGILTLDAHARLARTTPHRTNYSIARTNGLVVRLILRLTLDILVGAAETDPARVHLDA